VAAKFVLETDINRNSAGKSLSGCIDGEVVKVPKD
jgi:hypothetical protein